MKKIVIKVKEFYKKIYGDTRLLAQIFKLKGYDNNGDRNYHNRMWH